jgi:N-acylglucosamine-6-phosphate 2-epimerase
VRLPKGLIVSCQARADNPLHGPQFMGAMALAARDGGAVAIRANGPGDIAAVKSAGLPVIGIHKVFSDAYPVYITPNFSAAEAIVAAGAEIIALDCTIRARDGDAPEVLVRRIREELGAEVFADISGYTEATEPKPDTPDLMLVEQLVARLSGPVIGEGRYNTPDLVRQGFEAGAHAIVVGTMITNPREITRAFVRQGVPR